MGSGENATMALRPTLTVLDASVSLAPLLEAPCWEGRVAAVFQTSFHILGPGEVLLHLQGGPLLVSPFSLRVSEPLAMIIQDSSLAEGMPVRKEGARIEVPGCFRLLVEEVRYYCSPVVTPGRVDPGAVGIAKRILLLEGRLAGFDALPGARAITAEIRKALTDRDTDRLLGTARQIIGLGPGLTPSGDDFLVGCLKAAWLLAGRAPELRRMIDCLRPDLALDLDDRTTRVGAEFIRHALNGQFAEVLDRAAHALLVPTTPEAVASAVSRLVAQGETSGTDTAHGLLACLDAVCRFPYRERVRPSRATARARAARARS